MVRRKIELRKIENAASRQVTFTKRRKGLFKKAQELSTLCDADIALIVFSSDGKLFSFSNSSVNRTVERFKQHPGKLQELLSLELHIDDDNSVMLSKELAVKSREFRQMQGEDLQGLNFEELLKLEKSLEAGLRCVTKAKNQRFMKDIDGLKIKESFLVEENERLKKQLLTMNYENILLQAKLLDLGTNYHIFGSLPYQDNGDTRLKLG